MRSIKLLYSVIQITILKICMFDVLKTMKLL